MRVDYVGVFLIAYRVRMDLDCDHEAQALKT
jgi:hypothetical protein